MGGGGCVFIDNLPYKLIILWYATNIWQKMPKIDITIAFDYGVMKN